MYRRDLKIFRGRASVLSLDLHLSWHDEVLSKVPQNQSLHVADMKGASTSRPSSVNRSKYTILPVQLRYHVDRFK